MRGIEIRDLSPHGYLAFDLRDILALLGERVIRSRWRAVGVRATGKQRSEGETELEDLSKARSWIEGEHLKRLAHEDVQQVIHGEFTGFDQGRETKDPWVVISAVRSTYYVVYSPDPTVLQAIRVAFKDVSNCKQVYYE
jgi:hypothetical protein